MKTLVRTLAAAVATLAASGAMAQSIYVGGNVGAARLSFDCAGITCDKTDTAFTVYGGYRFAPNVAGEIKYFDNGKLDFSFPGVAGDLSDTGFGAGVALSNDFATVWEYTLRFGVARHEAKLRARSGALAGTAKTHTVSPYLGAELGYKVTRQLSITAGWDYTSAEIEAQGIGDRGNVNTLYVGAKFAF